MASTHPVRVPERRPEPAEAPAISRAPRTHPEPKKPRFTIKIKSIIPT
jgi:hypothetical protein